MLASKEGRGLRIPYRIRRTVGPWIDRFARALGQPSYHVQRTEYAGTVHCPMKDLEAKLREDGFSWTPFSLYHRTLAGTRPTGSWVYRSSVLADRQLHVILFAQPATTIEVYAPSEYSWLRHPLRHIQQIGIDRAEGAAEMRRWLDTRGLNYTHESGLARKITHLLERVRERFASRDGFESR